MNTSRQRLLPASAHAPARSRPLAALRRCGACVLSLVALLAVGPLRAQPGSAGSGAMAEMGQAHGVVSPATVPAVALDATSAVAAPYLPGPTAPVAETPVALGNLITVQDSAAAAPSATTLLRNFATTNYTGFYPADPSVAAGPNHIISMVNSSLAIYNKAGVLQYSTTLASWFSVVTPPGTPFGPRVVYDPHAARWIMLAIARGTTSGSAYLISVSANSDAMGSWATWRLDAGLNGSTASGLYADFPGLGFDSGEAVYLTSNQYNFSDAFQYAKVRILYKSQLYWSGTPGGLGWWDFWNWTDADNTPVFAWKPATAHSTLAGNYLLDTRWNGASNVTLWRITNPLAQGPTLTRQATIPVDTYAPPPNAAQSGGGTPINTMDSRTQEVQFQNGRLVTALSESYNWSSGAVSTIRSLVINPSTNALISQVRYGADQFHYYYPAMLQDATGNAVLVFNRSGSTEFVGARYTNWLATESSWQGSASLQAGQGNYVNLDAISRNRWGTYSTVALDPADTSRAWITSGYARTGNQWGTWVGEVPLTSSTGPANDHFANRITLSATSGTTSGSTTGATKETGEPDHYSSGGASVWWQWTAPSTGTVTLDTFGSGFDTLLAVYTGTSLTALTPIASNDDTDGLTSRVVFSVVSGTSYKFALDGYTGVTGSYVLNWAFSTGGMVTASLAGVSGGTSPEQVQFTLGAQGPVAAPFGSPSVIFGGVTLNSPQQVIGTHLTTQTTNPWAVRERWVDESDTYTASPAARTYTRKLPYSSTGVTFPNGSAIAVGASAVPRVSVRNDTSASRTVSVQVLLSRTNNFGSPDYIQTVTGTVAANSSANLDLPAFVGNTAGAYYATYRITTTSGLTGVSSAVSDTSAWSGAPVLTVGTSSPDIRIPVTSLAFNSTTARTPIYVEIDWMEDGTHSHRPSQTVIDRMVEAFALEGYDLRVTVSNAIPHQATLAITNNGPSTSAAITALRDTYFDNRNDPRYYYSIWCHNYSYNGSFTTSSGIADLPGRIHLVSLGSFSGQTGTADNQVGTFLHEFGHNIGQTHGGTDHAHYKPNYASVMNYYYQLSGIGPVLISRGYANATAGINNFGYSRGILPALDENNLNESLGVGLGRAVDWNGDGDTLDVGLAFDIQDPTHATGRTVLTDYDNYTGLNSFLPSATSPAVQAVPTSPAEQCITAEDHLRHLQEMQKQVAADPARAQALAAFSAALGNPTPSVTGGASSFTITNDGSANLSVTAIELESAADWISWWPSVPFTVRPGESRVVTVRVDFDRAPSGTATRRLLVRSNDPDENPYPTGVTIQTIRTTSSAPTLGGIETTTLAYTENQAATSITSTLTVADTDSTTLTGATVSITGGFATGQDVLAMATQNGISASYSAGTGVLTLTGSSTLANYQTALRSVTYLNSSDAPSTATRTVSFKVNDGVADSAVVTRNLSVTAVNDAPTISDIANQSVGVGVSTGALAFTIGDAETAATSLSLSTNSSNTTLVPTANIVLGGSGASRTVTVTPAAGQTGTATITVTVSDGTVSASDTFTLTVQSGGTLQFSAATYSGIENTGNVTISVTRTGGSSGAVAVNYATSNGTATAGSDYTAASGTLNWASGDTATKSFTVPLIDDSAVEVDETVTLTLSGPTGGATLGSPTTATLTIVENDLPTPIIFIAASDAVAGEPGTGDGTGTFTLSRTGPGTTALTVNFTVSGSATSGSDYTALGSSVTFAAGSSTATLTVTPINDSISETAETVVVSLSSGSGYMLGSPSSATVTINDDDLTGQISGRKWHDLNGNGVWDSGEPVLANWRIFLDANANGVWDTGETSMLTDANGVYTFTGLGAGSYRVGEVQQTNWAQTFPAAGAGAAQAAVEAITTTGSSEPIYSFGEVVPDNGTVRINTAESGNLIRMNNFRADSRFTNMNGVGYSVVVLDTGIDLNHPFFGPDTNGDGVADRIVYHYDFGNNDADASDVNGHGSNVSSIIGSQDATHRGMAPGVSIIHLKVFTDAGGGNFSMIESALQWIVANRVAYNIVAINMSLGDSGNYTTAAARNGIGDELAALALNGVIVVSASGNSFFNFSSAQGVAYPAADPNSLSIGAVYDAAIGQVTYQSGAFAATTAADRITPFSQRHSTLTTVMAPGAGIIGANYNGGTVNMHGTSQASPHIAGIAVLAQEVATRYLGRRLTMAEFRQLLSTTGPTVTDGDDEDDNVTNTSLSFRRVDMLSLAQGILSLGAPGTHTVVLTPGQSVTNRDFGNMSTLPSVSVAATDATAGEPGSGQGTGTFTFTRGGSTAAALTVNFTVTGTATSGTDYTAIGTDVTFAAGSATATKTVTVLNDSISESSETVIVTLATNANYTIGTPSSATVTIADDDAAPVLAGIESTPLAFLENQAAAPLTGNITVADSDSANLVSAIVVISSGFVAGQDVLALAPNPQNGISASFSSNALTLNGTSSVANYQAALRSITYVNASDNPTAGNRNITFTITDGTLTSNTVSRTLAVTPVNDSPTLNAITSPGAILEDAPQQSVSIGGISAGGGESQTLTVTATSSNPILIPTLNVDYTSPNATGAITYTPAANISGTATITVRVQDAGGTANGGVDSITQTFTVNVTAVNDAPSFTKGANQAVIEDATAQSVANWATAISAGPGETAQVVDFVVTNDNNGLFSAQPAITANGTLTFTPAANANGVATVTVRLHDNGGTANGGSDLSAAQTFTITINAVNDAPTISDIPSQSLLVGGNTGPLGFAIGDLETSAVSLTVTATSSNTTLVPQANITLGGSGANRTISVTAAALQTGVATITVTVSDGTLTASDTFDVVVLSNGALQFSAATYSLGENGGSATITVTRFGGSNGSASVSYATSNGTATAGSDYTATSGTLSWGPGDATNKTFTVSLLDDSTYEGNETVTLTLSNPTGGATLGSPSTAVLTITDNETPSTPPVITTQPASLLALTGSTVNFNVVATGDGTLSYQWKRNGTNVTTNGTAATLTLTNVVSSTHAGNYTVAVTNSAGTTTSNTAVLTVSDAVATHAVVGGGYMAGGTATITNTIHYVGTGSALGWQVLLPANWMFVSDGGSVGEIKPDVGQTGALEWGWTTVPASPVTFTYTVSVPANETVARDLAAFAVVRLVGVPTVIQALARPDPLSVPRVTTHSGDTDGNFRFSLLELTRVIELYNTRNGSTRTGAYQVATTTTEDGFAPDPTRTSSAVVTLTRYHSADTSPRDGKFNLLELTRVIELYNYRSGTTRTGQYHLQAGTEDGYAPGP